MTTSSLVIAVIGAGNIGGTLGRAWLAAGHAVRYGLRPDSTREGLPDGATRADPAGVVDGAARIWFTLVMGRGLPRHTALKVLTA